MIAAVSTAFAFLGAKAKAIAIGGALGLILLVGAYWKGHADEARHAEATVAAQKLADAAENDAALELASRRADKEAAAAEALQRQVDVLHAQVPAGAPVVPPSEAEKLNAWH